MRCPTKAWVLWLVSLLLHDGAEFLHQWRLLAWTRTAWRVLATRVAEPPWARTGTVAAPTVIRASTTAITCRVLACAEHDDLSVMKRPPVRGSSFGDTAPAPRWFSQCRRPVLVSGP